MPSILAAWPTELSLHLRYLSPWATAAWFAGLAALVLLIGYRSLRWLGPAKQWSIIGFRLVLLYLLMLILAGAEAVRRSDDVEVVVLRDVSASTEAVPTPAKQPLETVTDNALRQSAKDKPAADRLGVVSFDASAWVDSLPSPAVRLDARPVRNPESGTDLAAAMRLGMVCFRGDAMKRMVLISDGNGTQGNLESAISAAVGAKVPVDVVPMQYAIADEVMAERLVAPVWRRQGEPFRLDVVLRSAGAKPVSGHLELTHQGLPIDLDPSTPGLQNALPATLKQGVNVLHVTVPPAAGDGVHRFKAMFVVDGGGDTLTGNNTVEAFTFVRGKGRALYVDNYPAGTGQELLDALRQDGLGIEAADHISPDRFPNDLITLQSYDTVILANVPRGPGGISDEQGQLLVRYVKDTGGGLLMIGGPESFGAGGWQGSELEKALPVLLQPPAERALPSGALVLVIDHSGSMRGFMDPANSVYKMEAAKQSALLAAKTLLPGDQLGVVQFDSEPEWVVPLGPYRADAAEKIKQIEPAGGTDIYPALDLAEAQLAGIAKSQAATKHIVLLTDGQSADGDYAGVIARMKRHGITLSTIAVGGDADTKLLADLAKKGGGRTYVVNDPTKLKQVFIREASTVRRSLIQEPENGVTVAQTPYAPDLLASLAGQAFPKLGGMVLTGQKKDPQVQTALVSTTKFKDPILASWQVGLGKVTVFTGDATRKWSADLIASSMYNKLWTQLVRQVARAPMSGEFDLRIEREGGESKIVVEALGEGGATNGLSIAGTVAGPNPDKPSSDLRLAQVGPGRYEAKFPTPDAGAYVSALQYRGPNGAAGTLLAGTVADNAIERRDLTSNQTQLEEIARRTGGRVLPAIGKADRYDLFNRDGLAPALAYLPLNWLLIPLAAAMLIADVAVRRLQIDRAALAAASQGVGNFVRSFTTVKKSEGTQAVDALRKVREQSETAAAPPPTSTAAATTAAVVKDRAKAKFEPQSTAGGDLKAALQRSPLADAKSSPAAPPPAQTDKADTTSSLLAAKRRAQQKMNEQSE